jgi:anti-sigma factor RsiW
MSKTGKFDEWAPHAYVDGELSKDCATEFEAALANDPDAARDVADWRRQREALKAAFDGVLDEPIPPAILAAVAPRPVVSSFRPMLQLAAALMLLTIGAAAGWYSASQFIPAKGQAMVAEAITAHEIFTSEVKHPVEVAAADKEQLATWLSKRVGTPIRLPDLTSEGYTLLGGRLLASAEGPAAQLMYEDAAKKRLTIFLTANAAKGETAVRVERKGALIACYWLSENLSFAVAGEMDLDPMMKLARDIYDQFEA